MAALIAAHADWSVAAGKRWMALARRQAGGWLVSIERVGAVESLLDRLVAAASGGPVALGIDCPIGIPLAFAEAHGRGAAGFPEFLRALGGRPGFFEVAERLSEVGPDRPFYPRRGLRGMTRAEHAAALGLAGPSALYRVCDRATAQRPAGAPLFWTLGANQVGKAAISAWRDLLLPALTGARPPLLWPFEGALLDLLRPGRVAVAETYPSEALRQLGLRPVGSKRRQADRQAQSEALAAVMGRLRARPDHALAGMLESGFGADAQGEDRFDCLLGVLCVLLVLSGERPDAPPDGVGAMPWEGWVLGQGIDRAGLLHCN